ncbi:two-component system, response regulator YesN [Desulfotomaculum arcticum]|uniref:Stage 0 sporulation protein A homolog n=1 Tax=Desulfotruncus arcticus DSM 17038 TaxID=1121424 RepID=A0A1I2URD7_9FIRM|nr:helix-turn-helix domain-containing protein [Desulfotruncus arcticus]SFG78307.1 two-component system, response regulator YesN [Desulfotomaculum arcticum] [Desulfotruncus arcticus DSM 17038]
MYKVLICEDEALERQVLRYLLANSELPLEVAGEAANGQDAVKLSFSLLPDIVLMDIKMPSMDGLSAAKAIKDRNPVVEIVIITAYGKFSYSQQAIKYQVADYLLKPVQPEELFNTLKKIITRLEQRQAGPAGALESTSIKPGLLKEMINHLLLYNPEQGKLACRKIISEFLSQNRQFSRNLLASLAVKLLVLTTQILVNGGIAEEELAGVNNELAAAINSIGRPQELMLWGDQLVDKFIMIIKQIPHNDREIIELVKDLIHHNYSREYTLAQAASEVHLSPAYLSRIFKQKVRQSFTGYLTQHRLQQARQLLLHTERTIDEIAYSVGYSNNSYFTAVFKKNTGLTPSEYRLKGKNAQ